MQKMISLILSCLLSIPVMTAVPKKVTKVSDVTDITYSVSDCSVEELVKNKLGEGSYTYEPLYDFSGENSYTLAEGENCYLIYDNRLNGFLEYSNTESSAYRDLNKEYRKVYSGPTFYYYKNNSSYYDVITNEKLENEEVLAFKNSEPEKLENYRNNIQEYSTQSMPQTISPMSAISGHSINNSYYFKNLDYNIGDNQKGSCAYVAIGMLLSYYDSIVNDKFIDESYDKPENYKFSSYNGISQASYNESPGIEDSFHQYLISLGIGWGYSSNNDYSMTKNDIYNFLIKYFSMKNINATVHKTTLNIFQ